MEEEIGALKRSVSAVHKLDVFDRPCELAVLQHTSIARWVFYAWQIGETIIKDCMKMRQIKEK